MPADRIEQIQKMSATMMKPAVLAVFGFISGMFSGTVISLITAAYLRRSATEDALDAPPALT